MAHEPLPPPPTMVHLTLNHLRLIIEHYLDNPTCRTNDGKLMELVRETAERPL